MSVCNLRASSIDPARAAALNKEVIPRRDDDLPLEVSIWSGTSSQLCALLDLPQNLSGRLASAAGTRRVLRIDVNNPRIVISAPIRRLLSGENHD